jgi:hypothetical protein
LVLAALLSVLLTVSLVVSFGIVDPSRFSLLSAPGPMESETTASVFVVPDKIIGDYQLDPGYQIGDKFQIKLNISAVTDLYTWNVKIAWNSTVLNFTRIVAYGDFLARTTSPYGTSRIVDIASASNETGHAAIAESVLGDYSGIDGNGTLVTIEFLIVGYGSTDLTISIDGQLPTQLLSSPGTNITFTSTGSYFRNKLEGDTNGDKAVDIYDAAEVSAHWYLGPPIGPDGYDKEADTNLDGSVDIVDAAAVSANWYRNVP